MTCSGHVEHEPRPIPSLEGPGLLRRPDDRAAVRGGVGGSARCVVPQRDQPLFEHLARTLTPLGYAVLSYDRRTASDGSDTRWRCRQTTPWLPWPRSAPVEIDVPRACTDSAREPGRLPSPLLRPRTSSFLVLLGSCGVSPAVQMRYYTDELLRRAGYGDPTRAQLRALRLAVEDVLRGQGDRERAADLLAAAASEPWFSLAYLAPRAADTGRALARHGLRPGTDVPWDLVSDLADLRRRRGVRTRRKPASRPGDAPPGRGQPRAGHRGPATGAGTSPRPPRPRRTWTFPVSDISPEYAVALEWVGRTRS